MKFRCSVVLLLLAVCCVPVCAQTGQILHKDFYDKAPVWINAVLALFGFVGIGVAVWTVLTIKHQVDTFVSKERARITVDIEPFIPNEPLPLGIVYEESRRADAFKISHIDLCVANSGETNAFIRYALCKACIKPTNWDPRGETITSRIGLPKVMHPHAEPFRHRARIETGHNLRNAADRETAQKIVDGSQGIYVIGHIEFGDVFDNHWTVNLCRKWGAWWLGGQWQETGLWYDYPDFLTKEKGMNAEFQIERPSAVRRLWRRMRKKDPQAPIVKMI